MGRSGYDSFWIFSINFAKAPSFSLQYFSGMEAQPKIEKLMKLFESSDPFLDSQNLESISLNATLTRNQKRTCKSRVWRKQILESTSTLKPTYKN